MDIVGANESKTVKETSVTQSSLVYTEKTIELDLKKNRHEHFLKSFAKYLFIQYLALDYLFVCSYFFLFTITQQEIPNL